MCLTVIPRPPLQQLGIAAQRVIELLGDGTLTAALGEGKPEALTVASAAFDRLEECVTTVQTDQKEVSHFLRYRQEILGDYDTAKRLRGLVMNLWGGQQMHLGHLLFSADARHTRIALDCIVSYTRHGENDAHFMALADEIRNREPSEVEA